MQKNLIFYAMAACSLCTSIAANSMPISSDRGAMPGGSSTTTESMAFDRAYGTPSADALFADLPESLALDAVDFSNPTLRLGTENEADSPDSNRISAVSSDSRDRRKRKSAVQADSPEHVTPPGLLALLGLVLAGCLVVGLGPVALRLSSHKQRKRWRAIRARLSESKGAPLHTRASRSAG